MTLKSYKPTVAKYNATILKGISGATINGGTQLHEFFGDLDRHHVAALQSVMTASLSTTDLKGILDITGFDTSLLTGTNKLTLYWREQVHGGTFTGGGSDISAAMQDGLISIQSVSCSHGQVATASVSVQPTWDGTNVPITLSKTATAPSEVVENYAYTISAMKFGSTGSSTIPLESININFGPQVETLGGDGEQYPSLAVLSGRQPSISVTTRDLSEAFDWGLEGTYDGTDDIIFYFARLEPGASQYADGSSQHIKVTCKAHFMMPDGIGENSTTINILPIWDGTNAIFTLATASTIT